MIRSYKGGGLIFLLTPLREGRQRTRGRCIWWRAISTHAPAGGATRPGGLRRRDQTHFYSRPCGRGDMVDAVNQLQNDLFLLTPLREGRPSVTRQAIRVKENFYSRPCGRGDDFVVTTKQKGAISTHAPAGGATRRRRQLPAASQISTHAPAGGATMMQIFDDAGNIISTHAPAGGATLYPRIVDGEVLFLLTPLREGRRHMRVMSTPPIYHFYSRPCGRGDQDADVVMLLYREISTHAPAGGATVAYLRKHSGGGISTHAPAGGATGSSWPTATRTSKFLLILKSSKTL